MAGLSVLSAFGAKHNSLYVRNDKESQHLVFLPRKLTEPLVQVDERAGLELLASGTKRALGDGTLGHIGITQNLKEVVQLALEGTLDQVQQEEKHDRK